MIDTVRSLLESSVTPSIDFYTENAANLGILDSITEAEKLATAFTAQKVMVLRSPETNGGYLIEYANNLERFMLDQDMGIKEAMEVVASINEIPLDECTVVFDESCANKKKKKKCIELDTEFDIKRM